MSTAVVTVYPTEVSQESSQPITARSPRQPFIDVARGIAIVLVVLGHAHLSHNAQSWFQPFRMPLLFLTAGYVFNYEKHRAKLREYMVQRGKRLMLPYFITAALFFVFTYVAPPLNPDDGVTPHTMHEVLGLLLGNGAANSYGGISLPYDVPLWFLACLSCASVLFIGLIYFFGKRENYRALFFWSMTIAALGRLISLFVYLPWSFDVAMMAQFFLVVGFVFRQRGVKFNDWRLGLALGALYCAFCLTHPVVDMNTRNYPNFLAFYAAGISGTYVVFYLCRHFARLMQRSGLGRLMVEPWEFLGQNSLVIMAFHFAGFYLRLMVVQGLMHHAVVEDDGVGVTFLWLFLTSLLAVAFIRRFEPLKRFYY